MTSGIFIKYHDTTNNHLSISLDSARIDIFKDPKQEIDRFFEAYDLFGDIAMVGHPALVQATLEGSDPEISMYMPAFEAYDIKSKNNSANFPYSPVLERFLIDINNPFREFVMPTQPIVKMVEDKRSLSGNLVESNLVDVLLYPGPKNLAFSMFVNTRLKDNFAYLDKNQRVNLIKCIEGKMNPQPKTVFAGASQRQERERLHQQEVEEMRAWLKRGNRK